MADTLHVEIATRDRMVVQQEADYATIPGKDGEMGILPGHAALLSELKAGPVSLTLAGKTHSFTVTGGYVEVRNNQVRVLADSVE